MTIWLQIHGDLYLICDDSKLYKLVKMNEVLELVGIIELELDLSGMQLVLKLIESILAQLKHNDGKKFHGH